MPSNFVFARCTFSCMTWRCYKSWCSTNTSAPNISISRFVTLPTFWSCSVSKGDVLYYFCRLIHAATLYFVEHPLFRGMRSILCIFHPFFLIDGCVCGCECVSTIYVVHSEQVTDWTQPRVHPPDYYLIEGMPILYMVHCNDYTVDHYSICTEIQILD